MMIPKPRRWMKTVRKRMGREPSDTRAALVRVDTRAWYGRGDLGSTRRPGVQPRHRNLRHRSQRTAVKFAASLEHGESPVHVIVPRLHPVEVDPRGEGAPHVRALAEPDSVLARLLRLRIEERRDRAAVHVED